MGPPSQSRPSQRRSVRACSAAPGFDPRRVDVLDPQDDPAAGLPGQQPGDQVGAGVAEMLGPRRGRGQPCDEWGNWMAFVRCHLGDAAVADPRRAGLTPGAVLLAPLWLPARLERRAGWATVGSPAARNFSASCPASSASSSAGHSTE